MRRICQIIILVILIGCSGSKHEKLESDSTVINVFDASEIRDLSKILKFFEDQICKTQQVDPSRINECYKSFFERLLEAEESPNIEIKIPFSEQQEMYKVISDSTFHHVWTLRETWNINSSDTLKRLELSYDGKYAEFLKTIGKENKVIQEYYESFKTSAGITPGMVAGLIRYYESYDISDVRIRLIVAIHYLTLNDQFERKEKY